MKDTLDIKVQSQQDRIDKLHFEKTRVHVCMFLIKSYCLSRPLWWMNCGRSFRNREVSMWKNRKMRTKNTPSCQLGKQSNLIRYQKSIKTLFNVKFLQYLRVLLSKGWHFWTQISRYAGFSIKKSHGTIKRWCQFCQKSRISRGVFWQHKHLGICLGGGWDIVSEWHIIILLLKVQDVSWTITIFCPHLRMLGGSASHQGYLGMSCLITTSLWAPRFSLLKLFVFRRFRHTKRVQNQNPKNQIDQEPKGYG